ncbi:MAG: aminoglycoside phosphotransferase family protein [Proteobacteria bacterium]|nr:aminoglycoside phosphotransferase family protein [Pseudomonadota bacterium]
MAAPLPNPERRWTARGELQAVERAEIVDRIGPFEGGLEVLGGGLANTSVRVGERVLRLFRRDPGAVGKEAWLLRRPWTHFRTPRLLEAGDDFLLLEYVPHDGPITGSSAHGAAAGRALAEIHATRFAGAGFLGGDGAVTEGFVSGYDALMTYLEVIDHPACAEAAAGVRARLRADEDRMRAACADPRLLHGDFKASNLFGCGDRLLVLDWEFAWAGPVWMDLA